MIALPLLRGPGIWIALTWVFITAVFAISLYVLIISPPNKWDKAVAIKVCGGLPIVQREDGTVWLRQGWRAYRVDIDKLECAP